MNFQDNRDGLAAGITAIASISFFVMAMQQELVWLELAAPGRRVDCFLIYNYNPASSFMAIWSACAVFWLAVLAIKLELSRACRASWSSVDDPVVLGLRSSTDARHNYALMGRSLAHGWRKDHTSTG
jgi:hypothetical protein